MNFLYILSILNLALLLGSVQSMRADNNDSDSWSSLNVALVQYPLVGGLKLPQLMKKVEDYIEQASKKGSELLVLPELFSLDLLDYNIPESEQWTAVMKEIFPALIIQFEKLAEQYNIYVLAGTVPAPVNGKIRNRSYLFSPTRSSVYQEKMFLTPDEVAWGWEAADTLSFINAPWGKTAITICYDSEFPLISQTLADHSIDVLLIPSMTGASGFTRVRWAAQSRAVEHMTYVLVTGTFGDPSPNPEDGWATTAQAAVLGPSLEGFTPLIAEGNMNTEEIVYAQLNLTQLRQAKLTGDYYPAFNQHNVILKEQELQV